MPVLVSTAVLVIVRNRVGHGLGVPLKTGATVLFILSAASAVDSLFSEKKSRQKTFVKSFSVSFLREQFLAHDNFAAFKSADR